MAYFALTYQLNKKKDYPPIIEALKNANAHKVVRSFWLLDVNLSTASQVLNHFKQFIDDEDDQMFVSEIESKPSAYRGNKGTQAWIDARFN